MAEQFAKDGYVFDYISTVVVKAWTDNRKEGEIQL